MLTQKSTSIIVILVAIVFVSAGKCSEAGNWFTKSLDYYSLEKCSPLDKSNMAGDFNACMNSPVDPSSTPATAPASGKTGGWGFSGGASSGGFSAKSAKGFNFQGGSKPGSSSSTKQSTGDSWPISLISELQQIVNCFPKLLKPCMTKSEQDFYLTIRDFFQAQIDYGSANASSIAKKISSSGCLKSNSIDTSTICFSTNVHNQNWFGWKINWIDGQMCHFINDISTCEVKSFDKCPLEVKQFAVGLWKAGLKVTPCLKQTDETTATTKASPSSSSPDNSNQNLPVSKVTSSQVSGPVKLKASRANIGRADDQPAEQIKNQDQFETDSDAPYKRSEQRDSFGWRKNLFGNTNANDNFQANLEHSKLVRLHEVDGEGESRHDRGNRHKGVSEEQWTRIKEEYRRKMRESEESRESDENEYENESEESDEDKRTDIIGHQSKRIFFNPHFWRHQRRNNYDQEDDFGEYYGNGFLRIRRSAVDDAKEREEMEREKKADEAERLREEAEKQRENDDQLREKEKEEQRRKDEDAEEAAQDEEERQREIEEEKQETEEAKNEKKKGKRFTRSVKLTKKAKEEEEAAEEAREKEQEKKEKEQEQAEEAREKEQEKKEKEQEEAEEAREKEQEVAEEAREKEQEEAEAAREKEEEEAEKAREKEEEEAEEAREKEEQAREDEEEADEAAREKEEEEEEERQELEEKKREAKKEKSKRNKRDIRGRKQWEDYEERNHEEQERQRERFLERAGRLQEAARRRLETIERQRQEGEERLKRIREEADRRHEETKKRLEKAGELGYLDMNRLERLREESNKRRLESLKTSNAFKHRHEEDDEEEERRQIQEEADRRREENERQRENERRREEAERRQSGRREDNNDDNLIVRPQRYGRNNFVNNQFNNNDRNNDGNGDNSEIAGSALKDCIKSASNSWSYVSQNHKHDDIMEIMCRNIDSVHSCLDKHTSTNDPSTSHRLNHLKVTHQALCDSNNKPKDLNQVKKIQQCIIDQRSSNQQTSNRQAKYPDIFNRRPNWQ